MGKLTKKDRIKMLEWQVKTLIQSMTNIEEWSSYADNMLTELNHALPDPEYDAKREAQEADIDASLDRHRERLGLNKPQLKQLDQSVFDGLDERWRFAMVSSVGMPFVYDYKPTGKRVMFSDDATQQKIKAGKVMRIDEYDYDASNWQNSLIEREKKELTGSELCKAMIIGDRDWVLAYVSNENDATALFHKNAMVVTDFDLSEDAFYCRGENFAYAVPINNKGEPLTASEAGL